jgi:indolepyruvate ferredoxin oxidoreductase beta subunit
MSNSRSSVSPSLLSGYDIFLVGVGGQGVLTIADLIARTALRLRVPISFYPTKGMAQRGGFVKAQVRLGRESAGANIPEGGADLVIAMERSEALKAVRFAMRGGDFVLFGHVWPPAGVMLGKDAYPSLERVQEQVARAEIRLHYVDPEDLPAEGGVRLPANVFVLGAAAGSSALGKVLPAEELERTVAERWIRGAERNIRAFRAGLELSL